MYKSLVRPLLFQLDPEKAHHLSAALGQIMCSIPLVGYFLTQRYTGAWPTLEQSLTGIRFPNPMGMAAGFDKNAQYSSLLRFMGFGYVEYGSITAAPSTGNQKPRVFRLPEDRALVNRMGLNNDGAKTICRQIRNKQHHTPSLFRDFPCGINIAKTHDPKITGDAAIQDYITSYRYARIVADYLTLNISCPNTLEGKTFEDSGALADLLDGVVSERVAEDPPIFVKFSPDLDLKQTDDLTAICEDRKIDGYVLSNTSSRRAGLQTPQKKLSKIGSGGLSGPLLFSSTLERITHMRRSLSDKKILVGCGGIETPEQAIQLLKAGANLLQLYTGLIYEGPSLIATINHALAEQINSDGASSITDWLRG